jgi:hypothetical protein
MIKRIFLGLLLAASLGAQDFSRLPDWAASQAKACATAVAPAQADAWILLQRYELAYQGRGEIRLRSYRLVKVLGERGLQQAAFSVGGLSGKAGKLKKLKGWNLRPDGDVTTLDSDLTVTWQNEFQRMTMTTLPRAMKGSLLAFETDEVLRNPMGPVLILGLLEENPIRTWEFHGEVPAPSSLRLDYRNLAPWVQPPSAASGGVTLAALPPWPKQETAAPDLYDAAPMFLATVLDPSLKDLPGLGTWDALATWWQGRYSAKMAPCGVVDVGALAPLEKLRTIHRWISREIKYEDIYLSPERGWIPESGPEILRKHYGDCKDYTCLFLGEARAAGFQVFPAFARIHEGRIEEGAPVTPFAFNHVISAIRLERSLGLPAEVETPRGRFLIVDPTDRYTSLGYLNPAHAGRRVLVATDAGAVWLTLPENAVLAPELDLELAGSLDERGALMADLRIQETGNADLLRLRLAEAGQTRFEEHLRTRLLALPPTGTLEVLSCSDPMDLDHPFRIEARLRHPKGFQFVAGEGALLPLGLPDPPQTLLKGAASRHLPIERDRNAILDYKVAVETPWRLQPLLQERSARTAFRKLGWDCASVPKGNGSRIELHLREETLPAYFGYDALDRGVAEWKKDRAAVLSLREDGFAFKAP